LVQFVAVVEGKQVNGVHIQVAIGASVTLDCAAPNTASPVIHAEWDFHQLNSGTPIVIYDGSVVNPSTVADKYSVDCNMSSKTCALRINHFQTSDIGEYQCYLMTENETLKFFYELSATGISQRRQAIDCVV